MRRVADTASLSSSAVQIQVLAVQEVVLREGVADRTVEGILREEKGPGYFAAIDELFRLQEVGWIKFPTLQHLSWTGQWLVYARALRAQLLAEALVIPIFKDEVSALCLTGRLIFPDAYIESLS